MHKGCHQQSATLPPFTGTVREVWGRRQRLGLKSGLGSVQARIRGWVRHPHLAPAAEVAADHVHGDKIWHTAHVDPRAFAVLCRQCGPSATGRTHLQSHTRAD